MSNEDVKNLVIKAQEFKEEMWGVLDSTEPGRSIKDAYNRFLDELDELREHSE